MTTKNAVGNSLTGSTGTGNFVGATSPTLVTPNLGTPSAINLTNATAIPAPAESTITFTDITTNNVSITKHGFAPKAPNDATKYLDGTGAYTVPSGGGGGVTPTYTRAYKSAALSIADNTSATVICNTLDVDQGGFYNTSTGKWTPNVACTVKVTFHGTLDSPATGSAAAIKFSIYNSTSEIARSGCSILCPYTDYTEVYCEAIVELDGAGQYIQVKYLTDSGTGSHTMGGAISINCPALEIFRIK